MHDSRLSAILSFALGIIDSIWGVTRNTVSQLVVPDALRGRVMSVVMLVTRRGSQLGLMQRGFLVGLIGAPAAVLVGVGVIGASILASTRVRLPKRIVKHVPPTPDSEAVP